MQLDFYLLTTIVVDHYYRNLLGIKKRCSCSI